MLFVIRSALLIILVVASVLVCYFSVGTVNTEAAYCSFCKQYPQPNNSARLINENRAVAPKSAPLFVKKMINAANRIRHRPYRWGGGHRNWRSRGYDCSGAVSYVLHAAGLLQSPFNSTMFMDYGKPGRAHWLTIYANRKHVFMIIAGLRFDTSFTDDGDRSGPGWSIYRRDVRGFKIRRLPFSAYY